VFRVAGAICQTSGSSRHQSLQTAARMVATAEECQWSAVVDLDEGPEPNLRLEVRIH
jgi:hypothetical protein